MRREIHIYKTRGELEKSAALRIAETLNTAVHTRGSCCIALSGGETPRRIYRHLGMKPLREKVCWGKVHIFFGDERMVPPDDLQSNYGMVYRELISRVPVDPQNVHRIFGEMRPGDALKEYENEINKILINKAGRFDIIMLGLGEDGHTASLFPNAKVSAEDTMLARSVFIPHLDNWRITLTLKVINSAREIFFIVSGKQKASIVPKILNIDHPTNELPASMVRPRSGNLHWLLDADAAAELQ